MPDQTLCEHPNEVPHTCTCAPDCYCRGRMCDRLGTASPPAPTIASRWTRLQKDNLLEPVKDNKPPSQELFILRLFDMFDGWIDVSDPLPLAEAERLWREKTEGGAKKTQFSDGDYYRVFPANTRMMMTPEFLGR